MQIQNFSLTPNIAANLPQTNVGDVLQVMIKDRMNNQNAIVSMRGTTSTVKFEGNVPEQDKVFVEITGKSADGNFTVKVSDRSVTPSSSQQKDIQNIEALVNKAVNVFTSKGMSVTKENVASIKEFLTNEKGTIEQKMETLRVMAQREIPISNDSLKSVHEALNGNSLSSSLESVVKGLQSESVTSYSEVQREPDVARTIQILRDYIKNLELDEPTKNLLEKSISTLAQGDQSAAAKLQLIQKLFMLGNGNINANKISQLIQSLNMEAEGAVTDLSNEKAFVNFAQKNSSFENVLEEPAKQKQMIVSKPVDHKAPLQEQVQSQSNTLAQIGQDMIEQQNGNIENVLSQSEQYVINGFMQSVQLDSQNVMVTEISKKLSQMAIDFKKVRQDITKNLDNVSKMLESKNIPQVNAKQLLETSIHKLDKAILKGEFLLYTDMVTEKKLLSASSQLAEAKKLLAKGEVTEANKLVKEVKVNIEHIIFKPSEVKVKHFISDKLGFTTRQMANVFDQVVQPFTNSESSSRQMYETLRKLGLTHENEANFALLNKSGTSNNQQQSESVKAALLKMMKNEDLKPQIMQQVEAVVNNITGQQLLNKQDSSGQQNLFFQLPYMLDQQVENIKIYVNSRKDGDKVDWENCSMYFVLETKKLGDIGVLLSSSEKNVHLTFRSNKDNLKEKVAGLTEITQDRFKEIGYNLNTMSVKPLQEPKAEINTIEHEKSEFDLTPTFSKKGYDISI